jgi:hypothetical protein
MKSNSLISKTLFLVFIIGISNHLNAQTQDSLANQNLYKEISRMDSILFNAFNNRNLNQFKNFFTEDLEFYHDKGGLTGYQQTVDFLKTTTELNNQLRRELVKGTLEVYPIPGYGAMEIGVHTFCHNENGRQDCGSFKFVHVWKKTNGEWKISRVVSYGH